MIRSVFVLSLVVISFAISVNAQNRLNIQETRFQKQHMPQTEEMLIKGLQDGDPSIRAMSAQNIRDLEFAYPDEPFDDFLSPLVETLKNENEVTQVRILSAIALDGLHSDKGDQAVKEMSKMSSNQTIKELCQALLINDKIKD